jgi:hypothetical protein
MNIKRPSPSTILAATTGTLAPNAPNVLDMSYYTQEYHQRKLILFLKSGANDEVIAF